MQNWHLLEQPEVKWLVDGLLPADGFSAIVGKPKSGKSLTIRNLIAAVITGRPFLHRKVNTDAPGRVLYVHLDRKDSPARVAEELRQLGITGQDEVSRLSFMTAEDIPWESLDARLDWLRREVASAKPHLIVIDLLPQFICAGNVNDYSEQLRGINTLQDALIKSGYKGALVAALHGRKATNPNQPFDDVLGSSAQRGSFTTLVMLTQYRAEGIYTIQSDQTEREAPWMELDETVLNRGADGTVSLGKSRYELEKETKVSKQENDVVRLWKHLIENPGSETESLIAALQMSKPYLLRLIGAAPTEIYYEGKGCKGDPKRYFAKPVGNENSDTECVGGQSDGHTTVN
jgi:RecA-family ATPase